MTGKDLRNRYFNWMIFMIWPSDQLKESLRRGLYKDYFDWVYNFEMDYTDQEYIVLDELNRIQYVTTYKAPLDVDRVTDARDLRERFLDEKGYPSYFKEKFFDDMMVTVLEVMVAFAIRIDRDVMGDPDYPDLTAPLWFWTMVKNVNFRLEDCPEESKLRFSVDYKMDQIMDQKYSYYGDGGFFRVENPKRDMRKTDIWMQMQWYMSEKFGENDII